MIDEDLKWRRFGIHNGQHVYQVFAPEIRRWVESQSPTLWKPYIYAPIDYVFTKEFETLFMLRWS